MHQGLPEAGDIVAGKYAIERPLGRGGMGVVYVVSHRMTGKKLALKCLLPEFLEHAEIVERFMREAQAMGRIQHRHVVDVFDVGREGDVLYIVMELLEGKLLTDMLHDEAMTLEETLGILLRAMEGVAAAHEQGIIHRDLKPDNIFVCIGTSGRLDDPRVLDFGISKLGDEESQRLTRSGVAMGTPYYMSLEQMSGNRDIDQRVDVYAMGVILYEAIAGQLPYSADSVSALAIRVLTTAAIPLAQLRADLPEGLADVVMKAIAREREQRYPTMQALIDALRPFVPRGAGLLVAEGQGRPLRTPRAARAAGHASDATMPAISSASAGPSLNPRTPTTTPSAAVLASPAVVTQTGTETKRPWLAIGIVGALLVALGAFAYLSRAPEAEAVNPASAPASSASPPPLPKQDEPEAVAPIAAPTEMPVDPGRAAEPTNAPGEPDRGDDKADKRSSRGARGKPSGTPTSSAPPKPAEPTANSAKGRAGELTPDEF